MKLTELDKKILFELDIDGRASFSKVARAVKTTPQVVKYRFERLVDEGVIMNFWAFVDYDIAGYPIFWGYWMKFGGLTSKKEEEMFDFFSSHDSIPIVMRTDGYADVMLGIISKDIHEQNKIVEEIFSKYGKYIKSNNVVVGHGFVQFPRAYLYHKDGAISRGPAYSGGHSDRIELSEIDRKILSLLQTDGRMHYTEMAKILGTSVSQVQKHHRKMIVTDVITKTAFTFNHAVVDMRLFRVLFRLSYFNQEEWDKLFKFCESHSNIVNFVKVLGSWQLMLDVEISSREEMRKLLREMKYQFKNLIQRAEINEVYKIDKFTQMKIEYPNLLNENLESN